jgi:signal peptidase
MKSSLVRGLGWGALGLVALIAALVFVVPMVIGAQRYTIVSGSMEPGIPVGSLVVVQPRQIDDVGMGDVITFQLESGESAVATHRVVGEGRTGDGERLLVTQGDANSTADSAPVQAAQLRGVLIYTVPLLGWMNFLISGELRTWVLAVVSGSLVIYAVWMFVGAWLDRRRRLSAEATAPALREAASAAQPRD